MATRNGNTDQKKAADEAACTSRTATDARGAQEVMKSGESPEAVANRLKLTREALGYKPSTIARLMGVSQQAWTNWERGRMITLPAALKLCAVTRVHLDWIYRGIRAGLPRDLSERMAQLEVEHSQRESRSKRTPTRE